MAEELHLAPEELALGDLGVQLVGRQPLQHALDVPLVLLQRAAVDEDVVEEDEHELVQLLAEGVLHERHEGRRRVGQAHGQHQPLVVAVARRERRLAHVLRRHLDLPVAGAQVDLAEVGRALQLVEELLASFDLNRIGPVVRAGEARPDLLEVGDVLVVPAEPVAGLPIRVLVGVAVDLPARDRPSGVGAERSICHVVLREGWLRCWRWGGP